MNNYIENGDNYRVVPEGRIYNELPVDTYEAALDPQTGDSWLIRKPGIGDNLPPKIYGNYKDIAEHAIDAWNARQKHTGVLLSGEYGSGKTITAQLIATNAMINEAVPVIYVGVECLNIPVLKMLGNITTRCVVIFDEIDKCSLDDPLSSQIRSVEANLLCLLDGCTLNNHLYVLVANNVRRLPNGILNRPGRILYHWQYGYLTSEDIREVCEDRGVLEEHTESLCKIGNALNVLTYDTLNAIITECKEFGVDPVDAVEYLNVCQPLNDTGLRMYDIIFEYEGVRYTSEGAELDVAGEFSNNLFLPPPLGELVHTCELKMRGRSLLHNIQADGTVDFLDDNTGIRVIAKPAERENQLANKAFWGSK